MPHMTLAVVVVFLIGLLILRKLPRIVLLIIVVGVVLASPKLLAWVQHAAALVNAQH